MESRTTNNSLNVHPTMPYAFPPDVTRHLSKAHGVAPLQGRLKSQPEDFQVIENLGYQPSGSGEHAFLTIRKCGLNTLDVAKQLASFARVKPVAIGFAGLKDKQALTTQHFSVHLPGQPDPDWRQLNDAQCQIITAQRHHRKIRRGVLAGNQFKLILREIQGDPAQAEQRLNALRNRGFPNYFGAQRFGWQASNLHSAARWFAGQGKSPKREQKRMLLSAARSYLFNGVLAERVKTGTWRTALPGDVMLLDRTHKQFTAWPLDNDITQRTDTMAIHPSGPLAGKPSRALQPVAEAAEHENALLQTCDPGNWLQALNQQGVDADRRMLRVSVNDLAWQWQDQDTLYLSFNLPAGAYATILVRELMDSGC